METKISIRIEELEALLGAAKAKMTDDNNGYLDIVLTEKAHWHGQSSGVKVYAQSNWAECNPKFIYKNR
jgi:hypothetical protein